uniref:DUF4747 family protein n=1 Tax=uncultured Dysgonomonas sp. TaxID=206096 RepID=UPI002622C778|nr:DUF4747 family protein [uncultured Dysgonomonas sp.]
MAKRENRKPEHLRMKNATLLFINVKILPVGEKEGYINFFNDLLKKDYAVRTAQDRYISLFRFAPMEDNSRIYKGLLMEYTSLDPDGYINIGTKESIERPFNDDGVGANGKSSYFYFVPEAHRLAIFMSGGLSINKVKKFIEVAGERLLRENNEPNKELFVYIEKTSSILDVLKNAFAVTSLKAKLSYSNKDHTVDFEKVFDEKLTNSGANEVDIDLKTGKGGVLSFEEDSLPASIVKISESNGEIEARLIEREGGRTEIFNTEEYPRRENIKYNLETLGNIIYSKIMSIWRQDEN